MITCVLKKNVLITHSLIITKFQSVSVNILCMANIVMKEEYQLCMIEAIPRSCNEIILCLQDECVDNALKLLNTIFHSISVNILCVANILMNRRGMPTLYDRGDTSIIQ